MTLVPAAPEAWGTGAGYAVHEAALAALRDHGFSHAILWVLEDNPRARAFYERQGWLCDEERAATPIGGTLLQEVRYSRAL